MLAPSLKPNDTQRESYDINSIPTNKGNKAKGQPDGTKSEKNFKPCFLNPNIVEENALLFPALFHLILFLFFDNIFFTKGFS